MASEIVVLSSQLVTQETTQQSQITLDYLLASTISLSNPLDSALVEMESITSLIDYQN